MRRIRIQTGNQKQVSMFPMLASSVFLLCFVSVVPTSAFPTTRSNFLGGPRNNMGRHFPSKQRVSQQQQSPIIVMSSAGNPPPSAFPSTLDVALDKPLWVTDVTPPPPPPPPRSPPSPSNPKDMVPHGMGRFLSQQPQPTSELPTAAAGGAAAHMIQKSIQGLLASKVFRSVVVVICTAIILNLLLQVVGGSSSSSSSSALSNVWKRFQTRVQNLLKKKKSNNKTKDNETDEDDEDEEEEGIPMPFVDEDGNDNGWGVCTLRSKRRLGKTSFVQYDFDLPDPQYYLPLDLGQEISLCCLDNDDNVAKGDFYSYTPVESMNSPKLKTVQKLGTFSILAPNRTPDKNVYAIGDDAANFVRVLKTDLKVGDEVALQLGENRLSYRGQYLPVTDMVYIAFGVGIVPVFDQIRNVLPNGSSSVKTVSVVWINEDAKDFDIIAEQLEQEYFKYSTKLAVSCIVDDLTQEQRTLHDNLEIDQAITDFTPGTMAVLAGPSRITEKAFEYLEDRGYAPDCICVL